MAPFTVLAAGPSQAAPLDQTPFVTWNMQGATAQGANLWTNYLPRILNGARTDSRGRAAVVMLQEAGADVPAGSDQLPNPPGTVGNPLVTYANWHASQQPSEWYMVFLQTNDPHVAGGRVNTIVMSTTPVDEAMVVDNPHSSTVGRPAIGIRLGNDWYFSYHSLTGGGSDAVGMLERIGDAVEAAQPPGVRYEWTVGADFNTTPETLVGRPDYGVITTPDGYRPQVVASGQPTHRSPDGTQRELDYAVTTTGHGSFRARVQASQGGSDHDPVFIDNAPTPTASQPPQIVSTPVGGYATDGVNVHEDPFDASGMRNPTRGCVIYRYMQGCLQYLDQWPSRASAADAATPHFDYVGAVSKGNVEDGDNQEEAFPGQSIDELRQHLVGDLRIYKPNVVLLQVDVANNLAARDGLTVTQEANELHDLLDQIYIDVPNTTVLVGDPVPSRTPAVQDEMYTGTASYIAQSSQVIAAEALAGHRIRQVVLDFDHDVSDVDTGQSADGVPNANGYRAMAVDYAAQLTAAWQDGTIVDPGDVVVNPADMVVDGSGVDDTAGGGDMGTAPLRVMVVGDSMSEGMEGDWTWRYRLWQWFKDQHIAVDFVGPYRGTKQPDAPTGPPAPPPLQGEGDGNPSAVGPPVNGAYAQGVPADFDGDHFAVWGRQAAQDKDLIGPMVTQYQPDLVLFGIGFNDMGWLVSDATGTLDSVKTMVDRARAAKPDLRFAVANVPMRPLIDGRQDLIVKTRQYNTMLANAIPSWSTAASPVKLVDWEGAYSCDTNTCPAGYDNLHPNALGEYQIASAYEHTLHDDYGIGQSVPAIPDTIPHRPISGVTGVVAQAVPSGVAVTWNPVFGARGYTVRYRLAGATEWNQTRVSTNRYDTTWTEDSWTWEYEVRTDNDSDGQSVWSPTVTATAHPQTAPPPPTESIMTSATATGVDVTWEAPSGPYTDSIDRYQIITWDKDVPGAYISSTAVRATTVHIDGLTPGHHYLVAVVTWNRAGGGMPGVARSVTIGAGKPPMPTGLTVKSLDPTTVQLNWQGSPEAAGYRVWVRNLNDHNGPTTPDPYISDTPDHQIAFLFPGNWNFEFCVTAFNGVLESDRTPCVSVPPPPPSTGGVEPPSTSSRKSSDPAQESLLTEGRFAESQRDVVAAGPTG
ncbi:fibronectin type III domain-containing protein [Streptomyces gibsoniae]|uniref:Fibronectin type III domain-containing protein n=1 Tax=Streptomyces gibsoniae TaxID=3075529 RepID=A0ABU2U001_9ACTN|nr:fibronectin type III domain-containing protein [Streptomyces sp. DSM 41699]MDT0466547.1 fibronectin type III domain-containing protein [Streptomyces sp. DSM 41699]